MNEPNQHLEDIRIIKKIMEDSTRFLSLSGLSGVFAGVFAIAGAVAAWVLLPKSVISGHGFGDSLVMKIAGGRITTFILADAAVVLILALAAALFFSIRKARRNGQKIWTPVTRRLLLNMMIPLAAGGLFVIITLGHIPGHIAASSTLIFYGLALVNAGKFTLDEIYWLGVTEIVVGLLSLVFTGYTLLFWTFGFGILHIAYGLYMYIRYR